MASAMALDPKARPQQADDLGARAAQVPHGRRPGRRRAAARRPRAGRARAPAAAVERAEGHPPAPAVAADRDAGGDEDVRGAQRGRQVGRRCAPKPATRATRGTSEPGRAGSPSSKPPAVAQRTWRRSRRGPSRPIRASEKAARRRAARGARWSERRSSARRRWPWRRSSSARARGRPRRRAVPTTATAATAATTATALRRRSTATRRPDRDLDRDRDRDRRARRPPPVRATSPPGTAPSSPSTLVPPRRPGTRVAVDGAPRGALPRPPSPSNPGPHAVRFTFDGPTRRSPGRDAHHRSAPAERVTLRAPTSSRRTARRCGIAAPRGIAPCSTPRLGRASRRPRSVWYRLAHARLLRPLPPLHRPKSAPSRDSVRAFVDARVLPTIGDHWEKGTFPTELIPRDRATSASSAATCTATAARG